MIKNQRKLDAPFAEQTLIARLQKESGFSKGGSEIPDHQTEATCSMLGTAIWQHPKSLAQVHPSTLIWSPEVSLKSFYYSKILCSDQCSQVKLQLAENLVERYQDRALDSSDYVRLISEFPSLRYQETIVWKPRLLPLLSHACFPDESPPQHVVLFYQPHALCDVTLDNYPTQMHRSRSAMLSALSPQETGTTCNFQARRTCGFQFPQTEEDLPSFFSSSFSNKTTIEIVFCEMSSFVVVLHAEHTHHRSAFS